MDSRVAGLALEREAGGNRVGFLDYLAAIEGFLEEPTGDNREAIVGSAEYIRDPPTGFWNSDVSPKQQAAALLAGLANNDKTIWARFLFAIAKSGRTASFSRLKERSPFRGHLVMFADYGRGFVTILGDPELFVEKLISGEKGWRTYDADTFLVSFTWPRLATEHEVIWIEGPPGSTGPRPKDAEPGEDPDEEEGD